MGSVPQARDEERPPRRARSLSFVSSSRQNRPTFYALVGLLPPDRRDESASAWDIGEQEGALAELIEALAASGTALDDISRARIAVLAEEWGCWDALRGSLASCARLESEPPRLAIVEHTDEGRELSAALSPHLTGARGSPWPDHTAVAWIACRQCDHVILRVHEKMPWGAALSATAYAVVQGRATFRRESVCSAFDDGAGALAALTEAHNAGA